MAFYWERHPDGPFATLIAVATTYLDPEDYSPDELKALARRDDDEEMRVFKSELRQALREPARLPGDELFEHVEYGNGSDEAFLCWLWHELYGDEPSGASILTQLTALPEPFAERLLWPARRDIRHAASAGEWKRALEMLLAALAESNAPVSPAERDELAALLSAAGQPTSDISPPVVSAADCGAQSDNRSSSSSGAGPDTSTL